MGWGRWLCGPRTDLGLSFGTVADVQRAEELWWEQLGDKVVPTQTRGWGQCWASWPALRTHGKPLEWARWAQVLGGGGARLRYRKCFGSPGRWLPLPRRTSGSLGRVRSELCRGCQGRGRLGTCHLSETVPGDSGWTGPDREAPPSEVPDRAGARQAHPHAGLSRSEAVARPERCP